MKIGLKIRLLRHDNNLNQCQMAEKLNISVKEYSRIETGLDKLKQDTLQQIMSILGQTLEEYLV